MTEEFPYITNCLMGQFDLKDQPHMRGEEAERGVSLPDEDIVGYSIEDNW